MSVPIALTIAGSDSGGGAGVQADLKAFSALSVYGASVLTALTAQNTREVRAIEDLSTDFIKQQIDTVFDDLDVAAVKIGMLSRPEVIATVADGLRRHAVQKIVLDPVMVAKSGDRLLRAEAVDALKSELLPLASVITPNLPEAADLLGRPEAGSEEDMRSAGEGLLAMGPAAVLVKGGHLESEEAIDLLITPEGELRLTAPRVVSRNTHGTGCTLSSAITAFLARGFTLEEAVRQAKDYLSGAIAAADQLAVGQGHGPVHHFHRLWS